MTKKKKAAWSELVNAIWWIAVGADFGNYNLQFFYPMTLMFQSNHLN